MPAIDIDIERLIPHRGRMKLIDEVLELEERHCVAAATVSPRWPLYADGQVESILIIELAAQAAGISFGWHEMRAGKDTGKQGWLVGIKSAEFFRDRIPLGTKIVLTVEERSKNETYAVISGTARAGSELIGQVELQVFRPDEDGPEGNANE